MNLAALALVGLMVLAGCTATPDPPGNGTKDGATPPPPTPPPSTGALRATFDAGTALPAGWTADSGTWSVLPDASATSAPNVLRGAGSGSRSTLRANASYRDFEATIRFNLQGGDEGAGLSFRYAPDGDYRIVRYSVREEGWHYFILKGGQADKPQEASVAIDPAPPDYGTWVTLRVRAEGPHVQAWHDDTRVIDYNDPDVEAGAVGPFLRASAAALFDDLEVRPLAVAGP